MMQIAIAPQTPVPAGTPVIAGGSAPVAVTRALTIEDILTLRGRRDELSNQLTSAAGRRRSLASELNRTADPAARAGLEARIGVLDNRMVQLESDIAETGRVLSSDGASRVAATAPATRIFGMAINPNDVSPLIGGFMFLVMMPIAVGVGRMFWKRGNRITSLPPVVTQNAERMVRLEQSVDAIAVEIERISEGQRFVTKLLSEKVPALSPPTIEQLKDTMQYESPR